MSTTVGTLEKKVETVFENLTPAEKAKYVSDRIWDISVRQSKGFDEEAHHQDIETFLRRHVLTLSAPDYIDYITAEKNHDINKWAWMYFYKVIWYQDLIIALLGQVIDHIENQKEMTTEPQKIKQPEKMMEVFDSEIKMLKGWQEDYRKENTMLLRDVPWGKINAAPPDYPLFDLPEKQIIPKDNKKTKR
jgi:hypothetical protein